MKELLSEYGFMNCSLELLNTEVTRLDNTAQFIELQVHDKLSQNLPNVRDKAFLPESFRGYLTLHGEGETDGKTRVKLCSLDDSVRRHYVSDCTKLYDFMINHFDGKVRRLILHPDAFDSSTQRELQIRQLALSLLEIRDALPTVQVAIEPRGSNNQKKVLRAYIEDILVLQQSLASFGNSSHKIGLCLDIAQIVIVHGNCGAIQFLDQLIRLKPLPILEYHVSDVATEKNRVAVEIGKGRIDWPLLLPSILNDCNSILLETLGGVKVFQRSKTQLESLVRANEVLL